MKQLKRYFIAATVLISSSAVMAQNPGYLGKKLSAYYDFSIWPGIHDSYSSSQVKVHANIRHNFSLEYVVSQHAGLGVSLFPVTARIHDAVFYKEDDFYDSAYGGDVKLRGMLYGGFVKGFFGRKGNIAPLGAYHKFELCFGKIHGKTGKIKPELLDDYTFLIEEFDDLDYENEINVWAFTYSFGRQALYFDRLFVNGGASFTYTHYLLGFGSLFDYNYANSSEDFAVDVKSRFAGYMIFSINVGIGLLAL